MKRILLLLVPVSVFAGEPSVPLQRADPYPYQSITGTRYQYDLSRPGDQVRYQTDIQAQIRDMINTNVQREVDRGVGQYGGGIISPYDATQEPEQ